ncbi:MAG: hypothetical protein RL291_2114 [Pseudomonadota bacterium]
MIALEPKVILLLQVVLVVGLPLLLWGPGQLGRFFPLPIIQIFTGIALGPSVFEAIAPDVFKVMFAPDVRRGVETLANVALVLFVFLAGCEADRSILKKSADMVLKIGVTGVILPWIAGTAAAFFLLKILPTKDVLGTIGNTWLFAICFGLCMAVTALPVLAIILRELGFNEKPIGTIALAVGGVDDALLWLALAVLLPFAAGSGNLLLSSSIAIAGGILTIFVLVFVVSPFLERLIARRAQERILMSLVILVLFAAAAVNEYGGLHSAIGAFLTGLLLPEDLRHKAQDRLDTPVTLLLLPFLFLSTGLKTTFSFTDPVVWTIVLVAFIVCIGGKFIGVTLPAWWSGQSGAFSLTLGVLMQCKGLMEIVIVTILFQKGVIGPATFSALVIVALVSTAITAPLGRLCERTFGDAATQARDLPVPQPIDVTPAPMPIPQTSRAPAALPTLEFGGALGTVQMSKPEIVIGRHSSDDITVPDVRVSRHHARLHLGPNGRFVIVNQTAVRSEPNPVQVNGKAREEAELSDGDIVSIGGVQFTFRQAA